MGNTAGRGVGLVVMLRPWRGACIKLFLAVINDAKGEHPKKEIIDKFIAQEQTYFTSEFKHKLTFSEMKEDVLVECKRSELVEETLFPQPTWFAQFFKRRELATTLVLTDKGREFAGDVLL